MKIKIICLVINRWLIGEDVVTLFDNSHVAYGAFSGKFCAVLFYSAP